MNTELYDNVFWVGDVEQINALHCNPYLILDGDEAVLFDPGSSLDFEKVFSNIIEITPIETVKYVVLSHQDPDLCASLPLFEKRGLKASVVCHWRSSVIIQYYNIVSPFYLVDQNNFSLQLKTGRKLEFVHAPYLHFPGAVMTYDTESRILFSGDLFGGFSSNWQLFADDRYQEVMEAFHEAYMPSNDILSPVMEFLLSMDISIIAPQHGSVINRDIKKYITCLRDLECGAFLAPIKKAIANIGGYVGLCNKILKRYYSLFDLEKVKALFLDTDIILDDESSLIKDFSATGQELWDQLFEIVFAKRGMSWITVIAALVEKLSKEYDVGLPRIFESVIYSIEKKIKTLSDENVHLKELNERLGNSLQSARDKLMKDPITDLYNETFFRQYLETETENSFNKGEDFAFLLIDLDDFAQLVYKYSDKVGNETLKNVAYTIRQQMPGTHLLFKLKGSEFAYYIPETKNQEALETAENVRLTLERSESFIEKISATIGLTQASELYYENLTHAMLLKKMGHICRLRVRIGKSQGMNVVCSSSGIEDDSDEAVKILLVDTDDMNLKVLSAVLRQAGYGVTTCKDGLSALEIIEKQNPDFIICELMIPKLDAFSLREKLLQSSELKKTHFILLSYQRDEKLVEQAFEYNIQYFLKKPFMISELLGIIKINSHAD